MAEITPEKRVELQEKLNKLTLEAQERELSRLSALKRLNTEQKEMRFLLEKSLDASKETVEYKEKQLDLLRSEINTMIERNNLEGDRYVQMEQQKLIKEWQGDADRRELEILRQRIREGETLTAEDKERLETLVFQTEELEKHKELYKEIKKTGEAMGASMAVYGKHTSLNVENMLKLGKAMQSPVAFADGFLKGGIIAVINTIINLAMEVDKMESAFRQTTGASADFTRNLTTVYDETRKYGVTTQEAVAANSALFGTFTDFTLIAPGAQRAVSETTQILGEYGVAVADVATGMQIATKAFGQSAEQAAASALEINALAQDLGIAPKQMAADYARVGGSLAKLGSQGTKAFKDLAHISKITGMEMEKIIRLTDKFDTFEDAAKQTGQLNAALGGNFVNAMDLMMETDPAARFDMIRNSILDAGLSFDSMSYYQRKFYTDALGLGDVGDLAMMLSGNYDDLAGQTGQTSAELVAQKKAAKEMKDSMEELKLSLQSMIPIALQIVDWIRDFTANIDENLKTIKNWAIGIGSVYLAIKALFIISKVGGFIKMMRIQTELLSATQATQTAIQTAANVPMAASGPIAGGAAAGLGTFALAALGVGLAIGIAALGLAQLVKAFGTLTQGKQLIGAVVGIGALAAALYLLTPSLAAAAIGLASLSGPWSWAGVAVLVAIGAAAMAMGKGIQWATTGISQMVDSITELGGANSPFTDLVAGLKSIREEIKEIDESKAKALTRLLQASNGTQMNLSSTETMRLATINRETVRAQSVIPFRAATNPATTTTSQRLIITLDAASTKALLEGKAAEAVGRAAGAAVAGEQ